MARWSKACQSNVTEAHSSPAKNRSRFASCVLPSSGFGIVDQAEEVCLQTSLYTHGVLCVGGTQQGVHLCMLLASYTSRGLPVTCGAPADGSFEQGLPTEHDKFG